MPRPDLAYFWGEDAWSIERAARDFRGGLEEQALQAFDVWRTSGEDDESSAEVAAGKRRDRGIDGITERLSISPMFSAGAPPIIRPPGLPLRGGDPPRRGGQPRRGGAPGEALLLPPPPRGGGGG